MRQRPIGDFRSDYATHTDFCDAFMEHANSFYLLAFLLMTTHAAAEHCFVDAIEQAFRPNTVFREWTVSWIRRTLIVRAVMTVFDAANRGKRSADHWNGGRSESGSTIEAITHLADLDRFVFVMSVLERYSVHECSLLLGCPARTVAESRMRALEDLSRVNSRADDKSRSMSLAS